jgi:hypothetical protein
MYSDPMYSDPMYSNRMYSGDVTIDAPAAVILVALVALVAVAGVAVVAEVVLVALVNLVALVTVSVSFPFLLAAVIPALCCTCATLVVWSWEATLARKVRNKIPSKYTVIRWVRS